jgi:hypothetical protein
MLSDPSHIRLSRSIPQYSQRANDPCHFYRVSTAWLVASNEHGTPDEVKQILNSRFELSSLRSQRSQGALAPMADVDAPPAHINILLPLGGKHILSPKLPDTSRKS